MSRWNRWGRVDVPRQENPTRRAWGMLGRLRRTASTRLMWAFHQAEARQRVMPVESDWLRSLTPANPSPDGDPLALLVEAEARVRR